MTGDPYGWALHGLFTRLFLGGSRLPDLLTYGSLVAGLLAAVWLPLPVRALPAAPAGAASWPRRGLRALAVLAGLALPGAWDLLAGRAGLGALQALAFGACYVVARGVRGEGFLGQTLVPADRWGYFGGVPAGPAYLEAPALAHAAVALLVAMLLVNIPVTIRRARRA